MLPYEDEKLAPRQRALDLLSRMTLREKVGQLTQRLYGFRVYERHGQEIALVEEFRQEVERYSGLGTLYGLYRADPWSGKDFDHRPGWGAGGPKARNRGPAVCVGAFPPEDSCPHEPPSAPTATRPWTATCCR